MRQPRRRRPRRRKPRRRQLRRTKPRRRPGFGPGGVAYNGPGSARGRPGARGRPDTNYKRPHPDKGPRTEIQVHSGPARGRLQWWGRQLLMRIIVTTWLARAARCTGPGARLLFVVWPSRPGRFARARSSLRQDLKGRGPIKWASAPF